MSTEKPRDEIKKQLNRRAGYIPPGGLRIQIHIYIISCNAIACTEYAMDQIIAENLIFSYAFEGSKNRALDDISISVKSGELVAVLGHNGCGKTTLARHLNVLLPVQNGELSVMGLDARKPGNIWTIRSRCGMVFQNPDNQFVSSVVEEDLAFAPRNFGVPEDEIPFRVRNALETVGLPGFEKRATNLLSGGQKQRVAIAGVLAADPDVIVLDEVTAMLDPEGREEVLSTVRRLHELGRTILMISHYIEEAVFADRVVLMHNGKILADGSPGEILTDPELLFKTGLTPPMPVKAYYDLKKAGIELPFCPLNDEGLVDALCR